MGSVIQRHAQERGLLQHFHITTVFVGDRQKCGGKSVLCSLDFSGPVAKVAGDL
jgi:hypothetical protein